MNEQSVTNTYKGPSNKMEEILISKLTQRWKNDTNLMVFIHDSDIKTAKYWQIEDDNIPEAAELHDPGHMKKTVERIFDQVGSGRKLFGLNKHVISQFSLVVKLPDLTIEEKVYRWERLEEILMEKCPNKYYWNPKRSPKAKNSFECCQNAMKEFVQKNKSFCKSMLIK